MSLTTLAGIEPAVFRLEGERIIQLCYRAIIALVEFRSRHLSLTKRVLYQMSYESRVHQVGFEPTRLAPAENLVLLESASLDHSDTDALLQPRIELGLAARIFS